MTKKKFAFLINENRINFSSFALSCALIVISVGVVFIRLQEERKKLRDF